MTRDQRAVLDRLIRRLVYAEVADSWKGGTDPETAEWRERELANAKRLLAKYLDTLTEPETKS